MNDTAAAHCAAPRRDGAKRQLVVNGEKRSKVASSLGRGCLKWHVCLFWPTFLPQKASVPNKSMLGASPFRHDILGLPHIWSLCVNIYRENGVKMHHVCDHNIKVKVAIVRAAAVVVAMSSDGLWRCWRRAGVEAWSQAAQCGAGNRRDYDLGTQGFLTQDLFHSTSLAT